MMSTLTSHVYIDVSSLLHWTGPAVGMLRVEQEVAARAGFVGGDVNLCYYDVRVNAYRSLNPRYARQLVGWAARLEPPRLGRKGWRRFAPDRARVLMWIERIRLRAGAGPAAKWADGLQRYLLALRPHHFLIDDERGRRLDIVPFDFALGKKLSLGPGDVVLTVASDWWQKDATKIAELKRQQNFHFATLCYDIIPLLFPHYFPKEDVLVFQSYWERVFQFADLIIVNAQSTARDIGRYCEQAGIRTPRIVSIPLGCDPPVADPQQESPLRNDLEPERYALFVSTIEPRKNHALLVRVWKRLLEDGIPQRSSFKLVFVGRRGWLTETVQAEIDAKENFAGTLLHVEKATDEELSVLYANAAFCLYPSYYEGFGLPVVEAYARGKAVILSNGGALAELARDANGGLGPDDDEAWYRTIKMWILAPELAQEAAAKIDDGIRNRNWSDVAADLMAAAKSLVQSRAD